MQRSLQTEPDNLTRQVSALFHIVADVKKRLNAGSHIAGHFHSQIEKLKYSHALIREAWHIEVALESGLC